MSRRRRRYGPDKAILHTVRDTLQSFLGARSPRSAEEELLAERDSIVVRWRKHRNAYIGVVGSLNLLNLLIVFEAGMETPPFAAMFGAVWGAFLLTHYLNKRSWLGENNRRVLRAEQKLGLADVTLPASVMDDPIEVDESPIAAGVPIVDPTWVLLLSQGRKALERAKEVLPEAGDVQAALITQLEEAFSDLNRLAAGAERIRQTLAEIAPRGAGQLDQTIDELDQQITRVKSDSLRETFLANRTLLLSRRAKVEELRTEQARLLATAEGFLLAADNLRLDAARLGAGATRGQNFGFQGPAARLSEEVELLRRVEAELEHY